MQDDLHVFRLQQFDQCLKDRQIPCRYVSQAGLGYGSPVFNFYPPIVYFIAEIFHIFGLSYVESIKLLFILPGLIRPISMYLLARIYFGPYGGLISAIIFSLAPYQATNTFVRGAIAENLALSLIPLLFWSAKQHQYRIYYFTLLVLLLTHHLTLIYTLPIFALFLFVEKEFNYKIITYSTIALTSSSFFVIPAIFEKNLTTVKTMTEGYFDFHNHFASLYQIFISRFWGYGASQWGPIDDMSFQIGYLQWIIPLSISIYQSIRRKLMANKLVFLFLVTGLFSLFLIHPKSNFLWEDIPLLPYYQFPWRFLGLATFSFAFISGYLVDLFSSKIQPIIPIITLVLSLLLNNGYFKEDIWYPKLTDQQKLSGQQLIDQSGAGLKDYWPKYGSSFPTEYAPAQPVILVGSPQNITFFKKSNMAYGTIYTNNSTIINLPLVFFPGWQLWTNDKVDTFTIDKNLGLIQIHANPGKTNYKLIFTNTPIRTLANSFSLIGILVYIIYSIREKKYI